MIIESSQKDIKNETRVLFEKMKPYLDNGESFTSALRKVNKSTNTRSRWYRDIREYVIKEGYTVNKSGRNPDYGG